MLCVAERALRRAVARWPLSLLEMYTYTPAAAMITTSTQIRPMSIQLTLRRCTLCTRMFLCFRLGARPWALTGTPRRVSGRLEPLLPYTGAVLRRGDALPPSTGTEDRS